MMSEWERELKDRSKAAAQAFEQLVATIASLRHPETGCPWDLKQDHLTLRQYMIEEAYEAAEAMSQNDKEHLADELGDVLLQVVLNAQIARDEGSFSILEVIDAIDSKMRRRHPHVFARDSLDGAPTTDEIILKWDEIKAQEKKTKPKRSSFFAEADKGIFPATLQARKIGKIAEKIGFDWDDIRQVVDQLKSEVAEFDAEMTREPQRADAIEQELGDIYFTLAQVCRHLDIDPEVVAQGGNHKFLRRFRLLEEIAELGGIDLLTASMAEKEDLWQRAKKHEKKHQGQSAD